MKSQKTLNHVSARNRKTMLALTFLCAAIFFVVNLTISDSVRVTNAEEQIIGGEMFAAMAQANPTPPTSLISNRCSAYAAPVVPAPLRTFYIDAVNGNDSNSGLTQATAWKTLSKANNTGQAGDLFLLRGIFYDQNIAPANSGTAQNKITYRKEPGQIAVLDSTPGTQYAGGIVLYLNSHIVVDGIEIRNRSYTVQVTNYDNIPNAGSNNWLRNLYIHDSGGVTFRYYATNNRLEDSVITNIGSDQTNEGDAINLLNDADNNVIVRNYIGKAGHAAYSEDLQGGSTGYHNNNILAQNIIDNGWANNVYIGARSRGSLIECNVIKNATQTTGYNYARSGLYLNGNDSIVRYNYIYNNKADGIGILAYGTDENPENNQIYHNTVVGNGGAGLFMYARLNNYFRNNIIENNIFWNNVGKDVGTAQRYEVAIDRYNANSSWAAGFTDGNIFRYNNASNIGFLTIAQPGGIGNLYYNTPAAAQSAISSWTNNTQLNPLFVNAAANDYSLQSGSPMIDAGRIIPGVAYNGSAPDKGAFETGTAQTQTPYPGPSVPNAPTTIEVENFDKGGQGVAYNENFGTTGSSVYRTNPTEAVDIQARSTASNGYVVLEAAAGEWLEYTVNVPTAGFYNLGVSYSSEFNNGTFHVEVDGVNVTGQMIANSTGSWATFQTLTKPNVSLSAGQHVIRLAFDSNAVGGCGCIVGNFDKITLQSSTQAKAIVFNGTNYAVTSQTLPTSFNSLGGFQFIWRVRGAGTSGWQFGGGGAYVVNGSPNYVLADSREGHNVYMPPTNYSDSICKVQFDPANARWTFETWKSDGTGYVSRTQAITDTSNLQLSGSNVSFGGNSYGNFLGQSKIDYWGWIHRVEPLGNFPGTSLPANVNYLLRYEFDGNFNDSSATGINLTSYNNPTFENTP